MFNGLISTLRSDDTFNSALAGASAGALYKAASRSLESIGRYSVVGCGFFTGIDYLMRTGRF
jgi:hypothetical protein